MEPECECGGAVSEFTNELISKFTNERIHKLDKEYQLENSGIGRIMRMFNLQMG
jgi:hypothetical protein